MGHRVQLRCEVRAAEVLDKELVSQWLVVALTSNKRTVDEFERKLPGWARFYILAKLYYWLYLLRQSRNFDVILSRHVVSDPFAILFAPMIPNLVTVHHSKELQELAIRTPSVRLRLAKWLEGPVKRIALRRVCAVVGVTEEIAAYESARISNNPTPLAYHNGIDYASSAVAERRTARGPVLHLLMVANSFRSWHGLDKLLRVLHNQNAEAKSFTIHLVGEVSQAQCKMLRDLSLGDFVSLHGKCSPSDIAALSSNIDVAIASLAMERAGLNEATTLKVREYLALGIPVYSGHKDAALPDNFPYYLHDTMAPDLQRLRQFGNRMRDVPRSVVRTAAAPYINKSSIMGKLTGSLRALSDDHCNQL